MDEEKAKGDAPVRPLPLIDLAYLFGAAPAAVRYNPHVRQQPICTPIDLMAVSAIIRSRDKAR